MNWLRRLRVRLFPHALVCGCCWRWYYEGRPRNCFCYVDGDECGRHPRPALKRDAP